MGSFPWISSGRSWNWGMHVVDGRTGREKRGNDSFIIPSYQVFLSPTYSTHPSRRLACLLQEAFPDDYNKVESLLSSTLISHSSDISLCFCIKICFPFHASHFPTRLIRSSLVICKSLNISLCWAPGNVLNKYLLVAREAMSQKGEA